MTRPGDCPICGVGLPQHAVECPVGRLSMQLSGISTERAAYPTQIAQGILADPQRHVEALMESGVLKIDGYNVEQEGGEAYPIYRVVQQRRLCPAWVEVGFGRQNCAEEAGHDEGEHPTPHRSRQPGHDGALTSSDVIWHTAPAERMTG